MESGPASALLEALADGVAVVDGQGVVRYANPAGLALLGQAGAPGKPFLPCVHSEDAPVVREALDSLRERPGRDRSLAFRLVRPLGLWRWVEAVVRNRLGEPGVDGFVLTLRQDPPLRPFKTGESGGALRGPFQKFLDTTLVALCWFAPDESLLWANQAWLDLLGYESGECLGRSQAEFHADPASAADLGRRLAAREALRDFPARLLRKDGSARHVLVSADPHLDGDRLAYTLCVTVDVTDRRRTEEELGRTEALNRRIIESSRDCIQVLDAEGGLLSTSRVGLQLLEVEDPGEIEGISWLDLWRGSDRRKAEAALAGALHDGSGKFQGICPTFRGKPRWWDVLVTPILDSEGAPRQLLAVSRDITEQKTVEDALHRSEEQLRQSQKMDAVGRLAGGVAHDFNNLLTAISGYSDLLLGAMPGEDPLRENVIEIRKAGDRAAALTRQLLTFSRKRVAVSRVFDLSHAVADMRQMLARLIGEDIELATRSESGLAKVSADPAQVEQVILNLAVNARDAMPRGGRLSIEAANETLDSSRAGLYFPVVPGPYVRLTVTDTGVGMDEEVKTHLFEPFFTTKAPGHGTGLGLSMVYGIIQQAGGNLAVWSEKGKGTAITAWLPAQRDGHEEPAAHQGPEPGAARRRREGTVLLVEDESMVRRLVAQVLESQGYRVLEADSGEAALALAAECGHMDLLLTDVVMPGLSGREVAERLLELRPGLKVLYMSGYTEDAVLRHGVFQNSVAFLGKPFSPLALVQKIREVLEAPPPEPAPRGLAASV